MEKITSADTLKLAIQRLEAEQAEKGLLLKSEFKNLLENLKPLNVIKNVFDDFKENLLGTTVGLTAGYVSKAALIGASHNPVKRILGTLLQLGISTVVSKNPEGIKSVLGGIVNFFRKKKEAPAVHESKEHNY